ncbi:tetrahydromethanopterin S-methyltransferase subunit F [Planosporangium sp. 12N6]|uniref:tetrahydromethanopterin S-methyltransferase subunit F n=1 Tax=Planosporangium spinosum TaxID=3402278 RepID=UPI003CEDE2C3
MVAEDPGDHDVPDVVSTMSKERALRRAVREAEAQEARVRRERAARRRAFLRRLRPRPPRRGRTGRLSSGLSRAQRAGITVGALTALVFVWLLVDDVSTRIALTALVALVAPMLFVLTLDRRT